MKRILGPLFRLFRADIAMDLGTANTLLFTRRHGIVINEPSVVAMDQRDNHVVAVGSEARSFMGRTPPWLRAVRPLKDGVISDFDVTRVMIAYFVRRTIGALKLVRPRMVICIPTGITHVEKKAVLDAARLAGAENVSLVEEPMAAAIGAELPVEEARGSMVLDIGGGTSEVAVISLCGVAATRSARVAGDAMNDAVRQYLRDEFRLVVSEDTAEKVKKEIGSAMPGCAPAAMEVPGKDLLLGRPRLVEVGEEHVRRALAECVGAILDTLLRALEKTPPELAADISRDGVLMAGGGSLLHGLDRYLSRETGLDVHVDRDPLTTVLRGTAKAMLDRQRWRSVFIN